MTVRALALPALVLSILLGACHAEPLAQEVASMPACMDSQPESACTYGPPLCATVKSEAATCLMCRCSGYQPLEADVPSAARLAMTGGGALRPPPPPY
jgi:hypothetical protein